MSEDMFKINHSLNYDVKCLMYLMACKQYNNTRKKLHFSFVIDGITTKDSAKNFNRKESRMQEHI